MGDEEKTAGGEITLDQVIKAQAQVPAAESPEGSQDLPQEKDIPGSGFQSLEDIENRIRNSGSDASGAASGADPGPEAQQKAKPAQQKPTDRERQLQAEVDRLNGRLIELEPDAILGARVKSDPRLSHAVETSLASSTASRDGFGEPSDVAQKVNLELGFDPTFEPDPNEIYTPGTPSHRWHRRYMELSVMPEIEERMRRQEIVRAEQAAMEKERNEFMSLPEVTEEDFVNLQAFMRDRRNFTLVNLYRFQKFIESGESLSAAGSVKPVGDSGEHDKAEYRSSIASVGDGPGGSGLTHAQAVQLGMLEYVKNRTFGTM